METKQIPTFYLCFLIAIMSSQTWALMAQGGTGVKEENVSDLAPSKTDAGNRNYPQKKGIDFPESFQLNFLPAPKDQGDSFKTCWAWAFGYAYCTQQFRANFEGAGSAVLNPICVYKFGDGNPPSEKTNQCDHPLDFYTMFEESLNIVFPAFDSTEHKLENCDCAKVGSSRCSEGPGYKISNLKPQDKGRIGNYADRRNEPNRVLEDIKEVLFLKKRPVLIKMPYPPDLTKSYWPLDQSNTAYGSLHAMVITGYNDNFITDNGGFKKAISWLSDNTNAVWNSVWGKGKDKNYPRRGAFRVMNSFGPTWGPEKNGYTWIPYEVFWELNKGTFEINNTMLFERVPAPTIEAPVTEAPADPNPPARPQPEQPAPLHVEPSPDEPVAETPPSRKPTLFLITVVDQDDTKKGRAAMKDDDRIQYEFNKVARCLDYTFKLRSLSSEKFAVDSVMANLDAFRTDEEDVFVLYYRGKALLNEDGWALQMDRGYRVFDLIKKVEASQDARTKLVLTDFTQNFINPLSVFFNLNKVREKFDPRDNLESTEKACQNYRQLFLNPRDTASLYWISSHETQDNKNYAVRKFGGYFSEAVVNMLQNAIRFEDLLRFVTYENEQLAGKKGKKAIPNPTLLYPEGGPDSIGMMGTEQFAGLRDMRYKRLVKQVFEQMRAIEYASTPIDEFDARDPLIDYWQEVFSEDIGQIEVYVSRDDNPILTKHSLERYLQRLKGDDTISDIEVQKVVLRNNGEIKSIYIKETLILLEKHK